tara:strand:+ start:1608 stop:2234 length:627 start_codon:yes stop_codon:yes gene_type:complete
MSIGYKYPYWKYHSSAIFVNNEYNHPDYFNDDWLYEYNTYKNKIYPNDKTYNSLYIIRTNLDVEGSYHQKYHRFPIYKIGYSKDVVNRYTTLSRAGYDGKSKSDSRKKKDREMEVIAILPIRDEGKEQELHNFLKKSLIPELFVPIELYDKVTNETYILPKEFIELFCNEKVYNAIYDANGEINKLDNSIVSQFNSINEYVKRNVLIH